MSDTDFEDDFSERSLVLGVGKQQLGEFLADLLGQRRSTERTILDINFCIDLDWIRNLDHVIQQRIETQNHFDLVSFQSRIGFGDGSSEILNNRDALMAFQDYSDRISNFIEIKYSYLIRFPNSRMPEKQDIRFYAIVDQDAEAVYIPFKQIITPDIDSSRIYYNISHSNYTWGADLSVHISRLIDSSFHKINRFDKFMRIVRTPAAMIFTLLLFMLGLVIKILNSITDSVGKVRPAFEEARNSYLKESIDKLEYINQKTDIMFLNASSIENAPSISTVMVTFSSLMLAVFCVFFYGQIKPPSTVIANQITMERFKKKRRVYEIAKYAVVLGFVVGVSAGLFANKVTKILESLSMF